MTLYLGDLGEAVFRLAERKLLDDGFLQPFVVRIGDIALFRPVVGTQDVRVGLGGVAEDDLKLVRIEDIGDDVAAIRDQFKRQIDADLLRGLLDVFSLAAILAIAAQDDAQRFAVLTRTPLASSSVQPASSSSLLARSGS